MVPIGTFPFVPLIGVPVNAEPLQTDVVTSVIIGAGFTTIFRQSVAHVPVQPTAPVGMMNKAKVVVLATVPGE